MNQYPVYPQAYAPPFAVRREKTRVAAAGKTVNRLCLAVLLQTVAAFVFEIPLMALMMLAGMNPMVDSFAMQWLSTVLVPFSTALPLLIYMLIKNGTEDFLRFERVGFGTAMLCVLAGLAVCLAGNFPAVAVQDFFARFGYESASVLAGNDSFELFVLELFSTAILVPVMEEFAFRGVLFSALKKYGMGFAIVGSALIFALVHLDFANVVFAFIAGLVFGFLYAKTRNLWVTIAIHMLNNGIAVIGSYADFLFGGYADFVNNILVLAPLALGLAALILLLVLRREKIFGRAAQGEITPLTAGESAAAIARAPLFWIIVAMMAAYTTMLFF